MFIGWWLTSRPKYPMLASTGRSFDLQLLRHAQEHAKGRGRRGPSYAASIQRRATRRTQLWPLHPETQRGREKTGQSQPCVRDVSDKRKGPETGCSRPRVVADTCLTLKMSTALTNVFYCCPPGLLPFGHAFWAAHVRGLTKMDIH